MVEKEVHKKAKGEGRKMLSPRPMSMVDGNGGQVLMASFVAMILFGLGNKIFQKLQTLPMHNYPFFLNLMSTFIYIPLSFMYIIPMQKYGTAITKECRDISQWKFAVMGILDALGGTMQVFAVNFITNSSMIILLTQASIPISMAMSKMLLSARYTRFQYLGALIVVLGIIIVLLPSFGDSSDSVDGGSQLRWSLVLVLSCIPQVLSSVYKEKALGETDVDVIYMNGWIAIYQFAVCVALAAPSAWASNITVSEIPQNLKDGTLCYVGVNSVLQATSTMPVDDCSTSFVFVTVYLAFNLVYNILMIMILKYGSANILWLAMTIMVPLGNVAFSLDFVPGHQPLNVANIAGLAVIMTGLISYRFADKLFLRLVKKKRAVSFIIDEAEDAAARHGVRYMGLNGAEVMLEPLIDTYRRTHPAYLRRSPLEIRSSYLSRLGFLRSPQNLLSSSGSDPGRYRTFE